MAEIGGKALWTKELDARLLAGEIDCAVLCTDRAALGHSTFSDNRKLLLEARLLQFTVGSLARPRRLPAFEHSTWHNCRGSDAHEIFRSTGSTDVAGENRTTITHVSTIDHHAVLARPLVCEGIEEAFGQKKPRDRHMTNQTVPAVRF